MQGNPRGVYRHSLKKETVAYQSARTSFITRNTRTPSPRCQMREWPLASESDLLKKNTIEMAYMHKEDTLVESLVDRQQMDEVYKLGSNLKKVICDRRALF
jgi:hypothetical protein